ncbi:hypothetical protein BH10BAC3_BH10BAC3_12790 [soil metagenome]
MALFFCLFLHESNHKKNFVTIAGLLVLGACNGQTNPNKDRFSGVGGKWIVCVDTGLVKNYQCTKPYSGFEFMKDGSYKEYTRNVTDPNKPILKDKWTLNKNEFTIDQDDVPGTMELPKT